MKLSLLLQHAALSLLLRQEWSSVCDLCPGMGDFTLCLLLNFTVEGLTHVCIIKQSPVVASLPWIPVDSVLLFSPLSKIEEGVVELFSFLPCYHSF